MKTTVSSKDIERSKNIVELLRMLPKEVHEQLYYISVNKLHKKNSEKCVSNEQLT